MARFHKYSWHNVCLIASQYQTATRVAGFQAWRTMGRFVRKGEKGIAIMAPIIGRREQPAGRGHASLRAADGEYCPKGLVCLGCTHAQPKQSAAPIFRRMLASHERALWTAHERGEPAGQIAARQLEVSRIGHALRRAEDLPSDVAAATEAEAGAC